jgi:hypothetical protein
MRNGHVATSPQTDPGTQTALVRHIAPIVAGGLVTLVLTAVTASWMVARGILPPLPVDTAMRALFATLGCHLAARLAPAGNPRIRYALALGVVLMVLNVMAASARWGQVPSWYLLSGIVLPFPCAIIGGATAARAMSGGTTGRRHQP